MYDLATVFAYPSSMEGFGMPVLEAMAQGTAVVTSRGTATEEVAGSAGLVVDATDTTAIGQAGDSLLGDPDRRAELGAAGLARARTMTWETTALGTTASYERAVA
ncbi:MAG: glycosyltransferase [Acidimicrobiales bacterium]